MTHATRPPKKHQTLLTPTWSYLVNHVNCVLHGVILLGWRGSLVQLVLLMTRKGLSFRRLTFPSWVHSVNKVTDLLQEKTHSGRYNLPPFHIKYMSTTLYSSWVPPLQKGERAGWVCQQQLYGYMWVTFEHKTLDSNENKLSGNLTTGCSSTSCTNQPFELVVFFFLLFRAMGTPHAINDQSTSLM